jgi:molybdate transport system regulatory protein
MINARIWIENKNGVHLGEGRIRLLKKIGIHGSLSQAAESMGLSYRKAWNQIHEMNTHSQLPLVHLKTGGKGGGRATLTPEAEKLIVLFDELKEAHLKFMQSKENEFAALWS